MSASKYAKSVALAHKLLAKAGRTILLIKKASGGIDPVAETDTRTFNQFYAPGVILPVQSLSEGSMAEELRGRAINKILISAAALGAVKPEPGDSIDIDGVKWTIHSCANLAPDGTSILFTAIIFS